MQLDDFAGFGRYVDAEYDFAERRPSRPSTAGERFSEIAATADQAFFAAHLSRNLTRFSRRAIKPRIDGTEGVASSSVAIRNRWG